MLQTNETQSNTFEEVLANGREYWLFEAQFGPIPTFIMEMYEIDDVDVMNAQLVNDEDYADFLAQSATGIPMF
jgi:hypothetical protein